MATKKLEWRGLDKFLKGVKGRTQTIGLAVEAALFEEANELIAEAKREVPVDEGILKSSGHVQLPVVEDGRITVECGFGGPAGTGTQGAPATEDVGYAVIVHEDLMAHHTVGNAKYLENPLNRRRRTMEARMVGRIKARLKRK